MNGFRAQILLPGIGVSSSDLIYQSQSAQISPVAVMSEDSPPKLMGTPVTGTLASGISPKLVITPAFSD